MYNNNSSYSQGGSGKITVEVVEEQTGQVISSRMRLTNADGKAVRIRGTLFENGWTLLDGSLEYRGRVGDYSYRVSHGPQFATGAGGFTLDTNSEAIDTLRLPRHADLASENWYGGDLLTNLEVDQLARWLPADDLLMACQVREQLSAVGGAPESPKLINGGAWAEGPSYLDNRSGSGGLLFHHWMPPAVVPDHVPSSRLLIMAKPQSSLAEVTMVSGEQAVHSEIQQLTARDVPIWLASGRIDSIQVLSKYLNDEDRQPNQRVFFQPPGVAFKGALANGKLAEYLYWQVLEAGLRIPPSAGSGFGMQPTTLGYNRVYVQVAEKTGNAWWRGLRSGASFVTSGPLLRTNVNGWPPGHEFEIPPDGALELSIGTTLTVADPVEYLDVVFNGQTVYSAQLDEWAKQGGKIPPLKITESGWMLVRVVTGRTHTYRIASTAPYYFQIAGQPRISRSAVALFQAWLQACREDLNSESEELQTTSAPFLKAAEDFWQQQFDRATVP
ncbi:MAG: hypothetical protein KDB03_02170 [Planctomycetales bacterium]|nr:hypothetical protein [Planctomycetales bacterium]